MKKVGLYLVAISLLLIGGGSYLEFTGEKPVENSKPSENLGEVQDNKENLDVYVSDITPVTLEEIDSRILGGSTSSFIGGFYEITTTVKADSYEISYTGISGTEVEGVSGKIVFSYNDNVLSFNEKVDLNKDMLSLLFIKDLIETVALIEGYDKITIETAMSLVGTEKFTLKENGFKYNNLEDSVIDFAIALDKKIVFPNMDEIYLTVDDFSLYADGIKESIASGSISKGNVYFYYNAYENSFYFFELGESSINTYKSITSFIEMYYGENTVNAFKKSVTSLKDTSYENIIIDIDYSLEEDEIFFYDEEEENTYKNDYALVKVVIEKAS